MGKKEIDPRLLDPKTESQITEDMNRVVNMIDAKSDRNVKLQIDSRLLDPKTEAQITENMNRMLAMIDDIQPPAVTIFPPDWSEIGYYETPQDILNGFNYAKQIYQNWNPMDYDLCNKYREDSPLVYLPALTVDAEVSFVDMSNFCKECNNLKAVGEIAIQYAEEVDISEAFAYCGQLVSIEFLNIMNISRADDIFNSCSSLNDSTLSMIMYVLAHNTIEDYQGTKTLNAIGFDNNQITRCHSLDNYQDLIAAGWTDGV